MKQKRVHQKRTSNLVGKSRRPFGLGALCALILITVLNSFEMTRSLIPTLPLALSRQQTLLFLAVSIGVALIAIDGRAAMNDEISKRELLRRALLTVLAVLGAVALAFVDF